MTLTHRTTIGIIWNFAEQMARRGIGVVITLLLARFLTPADYGLVAMMAVFLAIASNLMDSGFRSALIRKVGAEQVDFNTAFYSNLALGALSYGLLFFSAPFIADFYSEPRLIVLIRVAGVNILINAFQLVQIAILSRQLNFKAQLQATIPAGIISGLTAIVLAYMGFGVWALIIQMLLASSITTALLWYIQGWRPSRSFSGESLSTMYNFGYKLFLSGLLDTIFQNLYIVVIAKLFSAPPAGMFFFATKIRDLLISQIVGSIQTVTYPALASLEGDDQRLKAGYRKTLQVTTFLLFPSMLFLAALAKPLFLVVLADKWLPAATYLQLMCIAYALYPLHSINLNILKVKGRSDLFLYIEVVKKLLTVLILVASLPYGIIGILIGQIILSVTAYIPNSYFSMKLLNYSIWEQLADCVPGLILSGVVASAIYGAGFLLDWPAIFQLLAFAFAAFILYIAGAHVLNLNGYVLARQMVYNCKNRR